jgi:acyl-coenzyme A synthetase/AMP-(fatty) acid ligase
MACTLEDVSYGKVCFGGTTNRETGHEKVIAFLAGSPGEKANETFRQMRNLLRANLGITPDELVMVKSNEIPKTSSGKLQRYKLMQRYLAGEFNGSIIYPDNI